MELITFIVLLSIAIALPLYSRRKRHRFPPGPKGIPIAGNAFDIPARHEWLTYVRWSREYDSDVIYLNIAGTPIYVLNSIQAITDLLEKRSSICSDREIMTMCHKIVGWGKNFAFMPYGNFWREHRRMFHQHFHPGAVGKYHVHIEEQAKVLLRRIHADPDGLMHYLRLMAGATILRIAYGIDVQLPENGHYIGIAEEAIISASLTGNAGSYLVDYLPILQYMPSWAPGAQFKRDGARWRQQVDRMFTEPLEFVKRCMANGEPSDCIAAATLAKLDEHNDKSHEERETIVKHIAGSAYTGGADTTVSSVATFVLAMLKFPHVQRLAQAELDRVVGSGHPPTIADKPSLPYVTAIMKETLRWNPVTPLAVPHKATDDSEYRGYFIPAGSILVGNAWSVLHDETRYSNPDIFDPTRFLTLDGKLDEAVPDPTEACFGFGRRICPGRHFAMDALWLTIGYILTAFNIEKPLDPTGKPIEPSGEYTHGLMSHPVPFKVKFIPRSEAAETLIRETA